MRRLVFFGLTLIVVAGCASVNAYQVQQAASQAKADRATEAARVRHVRIVLKGHSMQGLYVRWSQTVELGIDNTPRGMDWLLAHELSHHLLGHTGNALEQEMAANTRAVKVLEEWGYSEAEAVRLVLGVLLAVQRRGSALTGNGHDWCREYKDIAQRYPGQSDRRKPGECGAA